MNLGDKIRHLRLVEGTLRGLGREMTQVELARAIKRETGTGISQSYLSQIESGVRPHLTNRTRALLARFFGVHPGYLVDDPPGYHEELRSALKGHEEGMDVWLVQGAERFRGDRPLERALLRLASQPDSRQWVVLLGEILGRPAVAARFRELMPWTESDRATAGR
jgi:transcriptional regulator with XRE-family HTH domain